MLAIVPTHLAHIYIKTVLSGNVFSINHFRIEPSYNNHPRYESYICCKSKWTIIIHQDTLFTRLQNNVSNEFPSYPLMSSITNIMGYHGTRRMLIGTFIYLFTIICNFPCVYERV